MRPRQQKVGYLLNKIMPGQYHVRVKNNVLPVGYYKLFNAFDPVRDFDRDITAGLNVYIVNTNRF